MAEWKAHCWLPISDNFSLSKSAFSDGGASFWAQILGRRGRRPQSIYGTLDRGTYIHTYIHTYIYIQKRETTRELLRTVNHRLTDKEFTRSFNQEVIHLSHTVIDINWLFAYQIRHCPFTHATFMHLGFCRSLPRQKSVISDSEVFFVLFTFFHFLLLQFIFLLFLLLAVLYSSIIIIIITIIIIKQDLYSVIKSEDTEGHIIINSPSLCLRLLALIEIYFPCNLQLQSSC